MSHIPSEKLIGGSPNMNPMSSNFERASSDPLPNNVDELIISVKGESPIFFLLTDGVYIIGRDDSADITLENKAISRRHARLEKKNGVWHVTDLQSTNGSYLSGKRMVSKHMNEWLAGFPLQMGPFTLQWQSAKNEEDGNTLLLMPNELEAELNEILDAEADSEINLALSEPIVHAEPDIPSDVRIGVLSNSVLSRQLEVTLVGLPDHWYTLSKEHVSLHPKKHSQVILTFHLKEDEFSRGGEHAYQVRFRDVQNPKYVTHIDGILIIPSETVFNISVSDEPIVNSGELNITVENMGNVSDWYKLTFQSDSPALRFEKEYIDTALMPLTSDSISCHVAARSRPLIGKTRAVPFDVLAKSSSGHNQQRSSELILTPIMPTWLAISVILTFLIILAAVLLIN